MTPRRTDDPFRATDAASLETTEPSNVSLLPVRRGHDDEPDEPDDPRLSDVDEWGRSERMRAAGPQRSTTRSTRKWFRAEWEGLEKIPAEGGALLVANHAGAIPSRRAGDHARHRDRARPARLRPGRPLLQDAARSSARSGAALGGVVAHPDNAYRLLREQQQLVLVFPEGTKGPGKTLQRALPAAPLRAGRLRRDRHARRRARHPHRRGRRRGVDADRLEAARPLAKALRPALLPDHRQHARCSGPLGHGRLLPGQVQAAGARPGALRRARPTRSATRRAASWTSPSASATQIQDGALRHAARPPQRLVRLRRRAWAVASSITGLASFWGGRVAQALEPDPTVEVIVGLDTDEPDGRARAHRVRAQRRELLDPRPHRAGHPGRHDRPHLPGRRLDPDVRRGTMHEINVIGTMNLFAAASAPGQHGARRGGEVVDATSTARPRRTRSWFSEDTPRSHPARTRVERSLDERRGLRARLRRGQPARQRQRCCASPTCSAPTSSPRSAGRCELPVVPVDLRLRPAVPVRPRGRRRPLDPVRARPPTCPASTTWPATACCRGARWPRICGKRTVPHAARRHRRWPPGRCAASACRPAARAARPAALRPRRRQPPAQGGGLPLRVHLGRRGQGVHRGGAAAPDVGSTTAHLPLRARRRAVLPPLPRRGRETGADGMARGPRRGRPTASPS